MRCTSCRSYIPEGITGRTCPQCGEVQAPEKPKASARPADHEPGLDLSSSEKSPPGFAPFFTIRTRLGFGPAGFPLHPSDGSISFGPEGFSIVWDHGHRWEKIFYRDLGTAKLKENSVHFDVKGLESKIVLYSLFAWPRRKRAVAFVELLNNVRRGLTEFEVAAFQRRLKS